MNKVLGKAVAAGTLCFVVALGCNGDGPSGVVVIDVNGSWVEVSTLTFNDCGIDLPATSSINVTIIQGANQITFVFHLMEGNLPITGTFNAQSGEFSLSLTEQEGGVTLSLVQNGRFTSNTRYTSESTAVFSQGAESCTIRSTELGQKS